MTGADLEAQAEEGRLLRSYMETGIRRMILDDMAKAKGADLCDPCTFLELFPEAAIKAKAEVDKLLVEARAEAKLADFRAKLEGGA